MPVVVLVIFIPCSALAFLDFMADQGKKAVEAAAYADAAVELANEVSPSSELSEGLQDVTARASVLRRDAYNLKYLSLSTRELLNGPDWSSKRLDANIRLTTDYIRKLKRLIVRIAALGTDGVVAVNTTETNFNLTEMQKNQQLMILQQEDAKVRQMEKEQEEARQWEQFSKNQQKVRNRKAADGKLR